MGIFLISLNGTVKYGSIVNYRSHIFYLEKKNVTKQILKSILRSAFHSTPSLIINSRPWPASEVLNSSLFGYKVNLCKKILPWISSTTRKELTYFSNLRRCNNFNLSKSYRIKNPLKYFSLSFYFALGNTV